MTVPPPANQPSTAEFTQRIQSLRKRLTEHDAEAFLVLSLPNIRYLAGFTGSAAALAITADEAVLVTDGRYSEQAAAESPHCRLIIGERGVAKTIPQTLRELRARRLSFEHEHISVAAFATLREDLKGRRWTGRSHWVEDLRAVKSPWEIEQIRASVALNDAVLQDVLAHARPRWTEQRLAGEIEAAMRRHGAEKAAFDTIVASGPHGALPHAQPRPQRLVPDTLVVLDHGAILRGYVSDMTRMVCFGKPAAEHQKIYQAVRDAQLAALEKAGAGVRTGAVDLAARRVLAKAGLGDRFTHSTGHGIGLEIHEHPRVSQHDTGSLAAGMVITVEPGAYVPGVGGARVEDVAVVRKGGCEILSASPRDLICL